MALNVSYNYTNTKGIDTASINDVARQIFEKANAKSSALSDADLAKFNRVSLGSDLYSGKVDANSARQISMANSGMQVRLNKETLNSLKYLNSEASKTIFKTVDGKIHIPQTQEIAERQAPAKPIPLFGKLTESEFDSDKKGSNPFHKSDSSENNQEEGSIEESINLLA